MSLLSVLGFFPEYKNVKINVRERRQLVPFTSVPSSLNLLRPKSRWTFKINVSKGSMGFLDAICFKNLSDSARIGVLCHEMSHVKDFYTHNRAYILKIFFSHLSPKRMDIFEFKTDKIAIDTGAGYYLWAWSKETHAKIDPKKFNRNKNPRRPKERYMSPKTIESYLKIANL
jgi:hypothetical protein